jgi:hypothetical protein
LFGGSFRRLNVDVVLVRICVVARLELDLG